MRNPGYGFIWLCGQALAGGTSYPPPTTYSYSDYTFTITPAPTPSAIITLPPAPTGIAEIDIVFPRDGATYPAMSPFPVIFALQQPQILYKYGFEVDWSFTPQVECDIYSEDYPDCLSTAYGSISPSVGNTGFPVPDTIGEEPIFAYDGAADIAPGVYVMNWEFDISRHCDDLYLIVEIHQYAEVSNGTVTFTVEDGAPMPTLTSSCPVVAGMVSYWGTVSATLAGGSIFQGCPGTAISPPAASATPCSATLDAAQASSISTALRISIVKSTSSTSTQPSQTSPGLQTSVILTSGEPESSASFTISTTDETTPFTSTMTVAPSSSPTSNRSPKMRVSFWLNICVIWLCLFVM